MGHFASRRIVWGVKMVHQNAAQVDKVIPMAHISGSGFTKTGRSVLMKTRCNYSQRSWMIFSQSARKACPDIRGGRVHDHYYPGARSMGRECCFRNSGGAGAKILPGDMLMTLAGWKDLHGLIVGGC